VTFTQEEMGTGQIVEPSPEKGNSPNSRASTATKMARKRFSANYSYFTRANLLKPKHPPGGAE
jgi:hypothetical protein